MMPAESPLRVLVVGAKGRMGEPVMEGIRAAEGLELAGGIDRDDDLSSALVELRPTVAVDFTTPEAVEGNLRTLVQAGVHPVIGTTGLAPGAEREILAAARERRLGGVIAPNFAIGAVLMMELAARAGCHLPAAAILEYHHPGKLDSPSGTSLATRARIEECRGGGDAIPIHSVRLSGYLAHQEVVLGGGGERLTIRHDILDRSCFLPGILLAVRRAVELEEIVIGLAPLLFDEGP
ncbi:MAG: 4-hydroxy-tetrahydrodipicolinate reductase [Planctomycetota bacterium]